MPCMCWYTPSDENQLKFRQICVDLVDHIKKMQEYGDPLNCEIKDAHQLIDHLYDPSSCKERP